MPARRPRRRRGGPGVRGGEVGPGGQHRPPAPVRPRGPAPGRGCSPRPATTARRRGVQGTAAGARPSVRSTVQVTTTVHLRSGRGAADPARRPVLKPPTAPADSPRVRYRLVTRSDFDGLVCAVLLRQLDLIDDVLFVHPKDVQDGLVEVSDRDILTNLPYAPAAHLVFDHHHSESLRTGGTADNHVIITSAPSAARVVFDHYGGAERFPGVSEALMTAVDQADSAQYALEDVLRPTGWTLLNFLMDSRTGLGRFRDFRISQLPADDAAHRLVHRPPGRRRDPRAARRRRARRAVPRPGGALRRPAAPGDHRPRRRGRRRPAPRGRHPRRQPLHGLRAVPRGPGLRPRAAGQAEPEHRAGRSASPSSTGPPRSTSAPWRWPGAAAATWPPAPARSPTRRPRPRWPRWSRPSAPSGRPPSSEERPTRRSRAGPGQGRRQTDTWLSLSAVNGLPSQPAHRCSGTRPASRAMRSSSDGQT